MNRNVVAAVGRDEGVSAVMMCVGRVVLLLHQCVAHLYMVTLKGAVQLLPCNSRVSCAGWVTTSCVATLWPSSGPSGRARRAPGLASHLPGVVEGFTWGAER